VPERPKGTGCKPVGSAYGGSNPPAPTPAKDSNTLAAISEDPGLRVVDRGDNIAPRKIVYALHRGRLVERAEVDLTSAS
jgi:hypothetical protein